MLECYCKCYKIEFMLHLSFKSFCSCSIVGNCFHTGIFVGNIPILNLTLKRSGKIISVNIFTWGYNLEIKSIMLLT